MKTYSCSGTLGDTYLNLCILYNIAIKKRIVCRHYTIHKNWHGLIKQIYSLLPNIHVDFIDERDIVNTRIYALFALQEKYGNELNTNKEWCVFPKFTFPKFPSLPERYIVLSPQSGRDGQKRILNQHTIDRVIKKASDHIVVIGNTKKSASIQGSNIINLTNKTTLLEAMGIVSRAQKMVTHQGVMAVVSLSHRIPSEIHMNLPQDIAFKTSRIAKEWEQYCNLVENCNG